MSKRLWCALVIKDKLEGNNSNIPDVKFCWADDFDEATKVFRNANWPQYYWVKDKSICRIIKLFEMFSDGFWEYQQRKGVKIEEMLNKEVLRCLPIEQVNSPTSTVLDRKDKKAEPKPVEPPKRRAMSIQELQTSGKRSSTGSTGSKTPAQLQEDSPRPRRRRGQSPDTHKVDSSVRRRRKKTV